jgi:SAM-dependent methyltransferase
MTADDLDVGDMGDDGEVGDEVDADGGVASVARQQVEPAASVRANRAWWDGEAAAYQAEHGAFLGDASFLWCPEGLTEADAGLLGPVAGKRVLEVGCGAAQCARWLRAQGSSAVGLDLSWSQLVHARLLDAQTGIDVPAVQADAGRLPFADASFDAACSAYGALPFVADVAPVFDEVARVLRPGGRWVFSVTHPIRWCFPDDPGPAGLVARESYFDRRPYVELDGAGAPTYVEHHRTVGDWVRALVAAGFRVVDVVEPEWPDDHDRPWGQWSPLRGRILPGTAIFVTERA